VVVFKNTSVWLCDFNGQQKEARHGIECLFLLVSGLLLRGLGEEDGVDVGEDTTLGDGDASEQLVELLVVSDGELDVARHNAGLLVVTGSIAGKLKDLGGEVLEDGGEVDRSASTNAGGVLALLQVAADAADRELQTSLGRASGALAGLASSSLSSLSFSSDRCSSWWHFDIDFVAFRMN